jgi:hypothetical protein
MKYKHAYIHTYHIFSFVSPMNLKLSIVNITQIHFLSTEAIHQGHMWKHLTSISIISFTLLIWATTFLWPKFLGSWFKWSLKEKGGRKSLQRYQQSPENKVTFLFIWLKVYLYPEVIEFKRVCRLFTTQTFVIWCLLLS